MLKKIFVLCVIAAFFAAVPVLAGGAGEGAAKTQIINVASTFPDDSPQDKGLDLFKKIVEEKSNGRFEVIIHTGGAMGNERETFEQLIDGSVEFGANGSGDIGQFYPEYFCSEVPYIFKNVDQFWAYWNGPLGKEISDLIEEERGVKTVGVVLRGARYLTANKPIRSVADVRGLKIRLPQLESWMMAWEQLGALPTPINFSEVYLALQTGTVAAQENPPETILNYKFYEVQKYLVKTEHIFSAARFLMSNIWFDRQTPADQKMILEAMKEATDYANDLTRDGDAQYVKQLVDDLGMELIEVDKNEFQKAVEPVLQKLGREAWKPGLYEQLQKL
jgi:tripartite ATP-independent transporter DctP family solute receptor